MEIKAATNHRVEIHQSDIAAWFTLHSKDIDPTSIKLTDGGQDAAVYLGIPVSEEYLDTFLRTVINGLPAFDYYKWEVLPYSKDVVGVITWTA